jgi:hypothetical protein
MYLSKADLVALSGYRRPAAIRKWLRDTGFVFVVGVDGWPRVSLAHHDARMGGEIKPVAKRVGPNTQALKEMQR